MAANSEPVKLEDHAATAALYVTRSTSLGGAGRTSTCQDEIGKLSSAGATTSLKHAHTIDLSSSPSQGGTSLSSAGAAASLAHANQKSLEHWKQSERSGSGKAAYPTNDHQSLLLGQSDMSSAGSKAAVNAARDDANFNIWHASEMEQGYQAAGQAMRKTRLSPQVEQGITAEEGRRAMLAATGAMNRNRRRAESSPASPASFSTSLNSPSAARAATRSHGDVRRQTAAEIPDSAVDHSRILYIAQNNVNRQLYTSNPPVSIEVEEKKRQDTIHASALAMAKQMYKMQQDAINMAKDSNRSDSHYAANKVHSRKISASSLSTIDDISFPSHYTNLQEAAQKLASERLAKLHDEHQAYRNYYGQGLSSRKKLSVRAKVRGRASSDGDASRLDEEQSQKIRSEMSVFQSKLAAVDAKKRQQDRDALMAAAQRNVSAQMSTMDEKVFEDTGRPSPTMVAGWEAAAKARAQAESETRMANHGKVHIGSGKYLDQSEIDAIARGRMQPMLDEITEKAETQRAKDEELRLEDEERKRQVELERTRQAELKADQKKARGSERAEEKARRGLEKSQMAEEKRKTKEANQAAAEKEGRRKGGLFGLSLGGASAGIPSTLKPISPTSPITTETPERAAIVDNAVDVDKEQQRDKMAQPRASSPEVDDEGQRSSPPRTPAIVIDAGAPVVAPNHEGTPTFPTTSGVKGWFKGKFARRTSRPKEEPGFIGGVSLTGAVAKEGDADPSNLPPQAAEGDSMREVAMAGQPLTTGYQDGGLYSSSEDVGEFRVAPETHHPEHTPKAEETQERPSISSLSSAGAAEDTMGDVSPIEPPKPPPQAREVTSPGPRAASPEFSSTPTARHRGRDRITGFLPKGLGRRFSRRQREKEPGAFESHVKTSTRTPGSGEYADEDTFNNTPSKYRGRTSSSKPEPEETDPEEARDQFDPGDALAPPPKLSDVVGEGTSGSRKKTSGSPVRDSRFSENL